MNNYVTGVTIKRLRENQKLTQLQLAEIIGVSDKTISKWEKGISLPDIAIYKNVHGEPKFKGAPKAHLSIPDNLISVLLICSTVIPAGTSKLSKCDLPACTAITLPLTLKR